jgi:hypothetical protein
MKTFELLLADEADEVYAISLVEKGAIEKDFVWFGKEDIKFATADDEKRIVAGPLLIPEKKIIRVDGKGETYFVYFTAETIEKIAQRYMLRNYNSKATLEHDKPIEDVTLVESWVSKSRDADKSKMYGFNLPAGTWYGLMKINNDDIWNNYVKTGKVNGFSIEGSFEHKQVSMTIQEDTFISQLEEEDGVEMLGMIKRILKKDNRYKSKEKVEMESWSDYPDSVSNNAKRGIELNDKLGNKCATPVGKIRAQQLANKRPLSVETISRMYSYLSRAEAYYDENDMNACGTISFYLWGGLAGKRWAESKLKELGKIEMSAVDLETAVSVASTYAGDFGTGSVKMQEGEIDVFGYKTQNFKMCPGATETFEHLKTMPMEEDTIGMIRSAAQVADNVFRIEKDVIENESVTPEQLNEAIILVDDFKDVMHEIDEEVGMVHDVSYMDGHIQKIQSYLPMEMEIEEGEVNPCQSGYIMIGFKDKDGRQVPNCVPEK